MNRSSFGNLALPVALAASVAWVTSRSAEPEPADWAFLHQRTNYRIRGRVVDPDGIPLPISRLDVTVLRFDATTLKTQADSYFSTVEGGVFEVREADATAVILAVKKEGFLGTGQRFHFLDAIADPHTGIQTNLVLVLEPLEGHLATTPKTLPVLVVSTNRPEAVGALFPAAEGAAARDDWRLTWIQSPHKETSPGFLELRAGAGGGIREAPAGNRFKDLLKAPNEGYRNAIRLAVPRRYATTCILLHTREGYDAKIHIMISRRRGAGEVQVEVLDAALQTDGSGVLAREGDRSRTRETNP